MPAVSWSFHRHLTAAPSAPMVEDWIGIDLVGPAVGAGCLGVGTLDKPLLAFGDASGGPGSRRGVLRRVGLGVHVMADPVTMTIRPKIAGPLTG